MKRRKRNVNFEVNRSVTEAGNNRGIWGHYTEGTVYSLSYGKFADTVGWSVRASVVAVLRETFAKE